MNQTDTKVEDLTDLDCDDSMHNVYDLPYQHILNKVTCFKYLPFMPMYKERDISCCKTKEENNKQTNTFDENQLCVDISTPLTIDQNVTAL